MHFLEAAHALAVDRGYFRDPVVMAMHDKVPPWFRQLGTTDGLAAFESRKGIPVPSALREFYARPSLACFLEAAMGVNVFLHGMNDGADPPPLVVWGSTRRIVFALHGHSNTVCAASVDADDPVIAWGFRNEPEADDPEDQPPVMFSDWVYAAVEGHERVLDFWQATYERCRVDLGEARRIGNLDWVRRLPGMGRRLFTIGGE